MAKGEYYVYAHVDTSNQTPFYIGMGQGRRAYSKERHDNWISFVSKYSQSFEVKFIAYNVSQYDAYKIENYFIKKLGKLYSGHGLLVNWTDGGFNEGVYIQIGLDERTPEIVMNLTDYGKQLFQKDSSSFDKSKCDLFLTDIVNEAAFVFKEKLISDVTKTASPKKPWIIPFCLSASIQKNDSFEVSVSSLDHVLEKLRSPIEPSRLPVRPYVDNILHRVYIYFDVVLQEIVQLSCRGSVISRPEPDWFFYKEYWHGYIKVLQCINSGKQLNIKYNKINKVNHDRNDIHDFEISIVKRNSKTKLETQ